MCMLSFLPPYIEADYAELENGAIVNSDGHGWAIVNAERRTISIRKTMDRDEAISTFEAERERNMSGPAMFHSRIATSGRTDITGCHPFSVGFDRRTVLAHNGIFFSPAQGSAQSDTAIFAERILPLYGNLDSPQAMIDIERFSGYFNKIVILTVNPRYRKHAYLVNEDMGYWSGDSGIWHSTSDYRGEHIWRVGGSATSFTPAVTPWDEPGDGSTSPWPCSLCGAFNTVDVHTMVCSMCGSCTECEMFIEECQCYTPERFRNTSKALVAYTRDLAEISAKALSSASS